MTSDSNKMIEGEPPADIRDWKTVLIHEDCSLQKAMQIMDRGAMGTVLIVDAEQRLYGTVTDGDIRRGILKGIDLSSAVSTVMNRNPVFVTLGRDLQDIRSIMLRYDLKQLPILDDDRRIVDLVLSSRLLRIPLSVPDITDREIAAVLQVLTTPNLSFGPKLYEFEKMFSGFIGTKHAIAVNSGTSGLHLCVKALGIDEGDEVITTPFSFIASANSILFERAKPVFVDIEPNTLNMDISRIEKAITSRTKAILPVHVFGHPCEMDELMAMAKKYGLRVIEDSCEAIGAEFRRRKVGTFGDCAVFAFYPNKQMTTGEGGIIVTDDDEIAQLCRSYRNQGRGEDGGWLSHERIGYNYRLSELQCALGLVQVERINELLSKRQMVADMYDRHLSSVSGIRLPYVDSNVKMSWFVYVIQLEDQPDVQTRRDKILRQLWSVGVACNNYFPPIHLQPFYMRSFGYEKGAYPVTESISRATIALPFFNSLQEDDVKRVCDCLDSAIRNICV